MIKFCDRLAAIEKLVEGLSPNTRCRTSDCTVQCDLEDKKADTESKDEPIESDRVLKLLQDQKVELEAALEQAVRGRSEAEANSEKLVPILYLNI